MPPGSSRQSIMLRALLLASSSNRNDTHEVFRTLNSQRGTGVKNSGFTAVGTRPFQDNLENCSKSAKTLVQAAFATEQRMYLQVLVK